MSRPLDKPLGRPGQAATMAQSKSRPGFSRHGARYSRLGYNGPRRVSPRGTFKCYLEKSSTLAPSASIPKHFRVEERGKVER